MIVPGVRKMPTAITWPTTSATADRQRELARERARAARHQNVARTANWKARGPPDPNTPPAVVTGSPEARRAQIAGIRRVVAVAHQHVREARVVPVRDAEDVGDVEQVEHLDDRLDADLPDGERPRDAQVERVEAVAEPRVVAHERQQLPVDAAAALSAASAAFSSARGLEQAAAGVALERRHARLRVRHQDVHRHARGERPDRRDEHAAPAPVPSAASVKRCRWSFGVGPYSRPQVVRIDRARCANGIWSSLA